MRCIEMDSRHVTALLEMAWARANGLGEESPLDDWPIELAGMANEEEESELGVGYVKLLEGLEGVEVRHVSIRLWSQWERLAVAKWARVEEYLKERGRLRREKRAIATKRKRIYAKRMERIRGNGGVMPNGQVLASVEELEAMAIAAEKEASVGKDRMASMRAARFWNQAEIRRKEVEMAKRKNGELEVVKEVEEPVIEEGRPEVEMEVIRVGPNPRIVVCRYRLLAEELIVKLKVHSNVNFVKGMKIRMVEQIGEEWEYRGGLPRRKGRW